MISKDLKILNKLKKEDHSGFKELFDLYYIPLSMYSLKFCNSFEMAEDMTQDIFVKFWDEKIYLKLEGAIAPYLFKSVKNNTLQALKKNSKFVCEEIENYVNNLIEDEVDMRTIENEKIYNEVENLPEKCREVFKVIVLENLKYKQAAESLDISVNTVKTHYSRALRQLQKSLGIIIILLLN